MSVMDPSEVKKAMLRLERPNAMADPDQQLDANIYAKHAINRQAGAAVAGSLLGGIDPAYEAERKAREERELRAGCLQMASQQHFGGGDVVDRAKKFYDFIKG